MVGPARRAAGRAARVPGTVHHTPRQCGETCSRCLANNSPEPGGNHLFTRENRFAGLTAPGKRLPRPPNLSPAQLISIWRAKWISAITGVFPAVSAWLPLSCWAAAASQQFLAEHRRTAPPGERPAMPRPSGFLWRRWAGGRRAGRQWPG